MERSGGQGESLELFLGGGDQCWMTVTEVRGRIRGQEVQVRLAVAVSEHRSRAACHHNIERVVVVSDVFILDLQQLAGMGEDMVRCDHDEVLPRSWDGTSREGGAGLISWVQHFTLPPPLISSLRSTEIGQ